MLRYALPMIPTNAFWWITDLSDRYILTYFKGEGANGLYAVSYKIPTIMILLVGIFMDAWQISILTETSRLARQKFFARVFSMYQSVVFVSASGLIVFAKVITKILVSSGFYESWQYIPMLILATCFSCFVTFFGTIYVVEKKEHFHSRHHHSRRGAQYYRQFPLNSQNGGAGGGAVHLPSAMRRFSLSGWCIPTR